MTDAATAGPAALPHTPYTIPSLAAIERGNCGVGFVASRKNEASHRIVSLAIDGLSNLQHRGGLSSDQTTGDGAGLMVNIPRQFFARQWAQLTKFYPNPGDLAVGVFFFASTNADLAQRAMEKALRQYGIKRFVWRSVPTNPAVLGRRARTTMPVVRQLLLMRPPTMPPIDYDRALYLARKAFEREAVTRQWRAYVVSMSTRTMVYKGLMLAPQLGQFYGDLRNPEFAVRMAVFHQRYSTNTLPSWERAQPFRMLCHNGEINTIQGNIAWAHARTPLLEAEFDHGLSFTAETLAPVLDVTGSDSAMLDNMLELLHLGGRDLPHAMAMLMPAAWEHNNEMPQQVRDFYAVHAYLQEPWDGPAAIVFANGDVIGATLDRNGLRPLRYSLTEDMLVVSSEDGAVPLREDTIISRGKLGPGQMIAADLDRGTVYTDRDIKQRIAADYDYSAALDGITLPVTDPEPAPTDLTEQQAAFGYTHEETVVVLRPMAGDGKEPVGSMGDDTPQAALTHVPRPLASYFRQRFAEVTNPAIDPLRETLVMSLRVRIGPTGNRLEKSPQLAARQLKLRSPVLRPADMAAIMAQDTFSSCRLSTLFDAADGPDGMAVALDALINSATTAVTAGCGILILSDRGVDAQHSFIPALLAVSAVHHALIRSGLRGKVSLLAESGEPRDVHQFAALIGYGAEAVCPYLAWAVAADVARKLDADTAQANYRKAVEGGLRKIMSKIGISTLDGYCGAQIFEAIGIDRAVLDTHFTGTPGHAPGATLADIAGIVLQWHADAFHDAARPKLPSPGYYKFKRQGEPHAYSPATVHGLHEAVQTDGALNGQFAVAYKRFEAFNTQLAEEPPMHLRDLLDMRPLGDETPLAEVEPAALITRRFSTAAMSHGSISSEAHEALAIGMNQLGAWSNSGEGGEHRARFDTIANSRIKQVASGRFGVTPEYLLAADELQIKIAQGAKPGEGGQLPGFKVNGEIAAIRHSQPGVTLISPPPHHDIYSIEDLAQLIFDLRQINPSAVISVKLVSQHGVGTIAAGVAKAGADVIGISGHSGGTGAAVWSSIKGAGLPWELGLVDTQRALRNSGLRGMVRLRVDGGFRNGRDVVIAAMLGADEFSFGTSALVAIGCIMARACHRNICPAGIATQRHDLRAKFVGTPEHLMTYMTLVAEDVRRWLGRLGAHSLGQLVGRRDLLTQTLPGLPGRPALDLSVLCEPPVGDEPISHAHILNSYDRDEPLNRTLRTDAMFNVKIGRPLHLSYAIKNSNRAFGALLSREIIGQRGRDGLPDDTITVDVRGIAGQSFGAFNAPGLTLRLTGGANDYVGKGMGGGCLVIRPYDEYVGQHPTLAGNTLLYGATGGEFYLAGRVGERFAVRNSGAHAVVEGVGDHGCEYMTGGQVLILGRTGLNFGAGMTGGVAYIWDADGGLANRLNGDVTPRAIDNDEADTVRAWLQRHADLTGSSRAAHLLADWDTLRAQFVCVLPNAFAEPQDRDDAEIGEDAPALVPGD